MMSLDPVSRLWKMQYKIIQPTVSESYIPGFSDFEEKPNVDDLETISGRISFTNIATVNQVNGIPIAVSVIKFICSPDLKISIGSMIYDTKSEYYYKCSGNPAVYSKHQEIMLERVSDYK